MRGAGAVCWPESRPAGKHNNAHPMRVQDPPLPARQLRIVIFTHPNAKESPMKTATAAVNSPRRSCDRKGTIRRAGERGRRWGPCELIQSPLGRGPGRIASRQPAWASDARRLGEPRSAARFGKPRSNGFRWQEASRCHASRGMPTERRADLPATRASGRPPPKASASAERAVARRGPAYTFV